MIDIKSNFNNAFDSWSTKLDYVEVSDDNTRAILGGAVYLGSGTYMALSYSFLTLYPEASLILLWTVVGLIAGLIEIVEK